MEPFVDIYSQKIRNDSEALSLVSTTIAECKGLIMQIIRTDMIPSHDKEQNSIE